MDVSDMKYLIWWLTLGVSYKSLYFRDILQLRFN